MCEVTIGFIGVVIGAIIGLIPYFIERKERYKFESYKNELERRLEEFKKDLEIKYEVRIKTHQEAFTRLMLLNDALNIGNKVKINEVADEARDWWNKNCFYLDSVSRQKFFSLTQRSHMFARDLGEKDPDARRASRDIWDLLGDTINSVREGIKVEHLDVLKGPKEKEEN